MLLLAFHTGARPLPRPDFWYPPAPGRDDLGPVWLAYSFVSISHHTTRGKVRPVMG